MVLRESSRRQALQAEKKIVQVIGSSLGVSDNWLKAVMALSQDTGTYPVRYSPNRISHRLYIWKRGYRNTEATEK